MSFYVRAALAVALLAGFYGLGAALFAGLAALTVWAFVAFPGDEIAYALGGVTAATAASLAVPAWQLLRAGTEPPADGLPVDEATAPGLWSEVRDLAQAAGTRPPDEIRLVAAANAFVWEETGRLGLRGGRRLLCVGVPLLAKWDTGRLRSVLAHELGHYAGAHTRLGAVTYRGLIAIDRTIAAAGPDSFAGLVLTGYGAVYAVVSMAVARRMELEADELAARAAGRDAFAAALSDLPGLTAAWESAVADHARRSRTAGHTATALLQRFARRSLKKSLGEGLPDPLDTHPPIAVRLAHIEQLPAGPIPDPSPAAALVGGRGTLAAALEGTDEGAIAVWRAAQRQAEAEAEPLDAILTRLADGRGTGDVLAAVVATGTAHWIYTWGEPLAVSPPELTELAAAACRDPAAVPPLRDLLRQIGAL